jgi:hypothetical protein
MAGGSAWICQSGAFSPAVYLHNLLLNGCPGSSHLVHSRSWPHCRRFGVYQCRTISIRCLEIIGAEKRPPRTDLFVRAGLGALQISEQPPIDCSCPVISGPEPHGQRESRRCIICCQPEDHRRAITRCGADWRPAATQGRFCHRGMDLAGYCDVCSSPVDLTCGQMDERPRL